MIDEPNLWPGSALRMTPAQTTPQPLWGMSTRSVIVAAVVSVIAFILGKELAAPLIKG